MRVTQQQLCLSARHTNTPIPFHVLFIARTHTHTRARTPQSHLSTHTSSKDSNSDSSFNQTSCKLNDVHYSEAARTTTTAAEIRTANRVEQKRTKRCQNSA